MISILAAIYFLVAAIITHVVSTQYNFFSDYISDYAIGSWVGFTDRRFWRHASGVLLLRFP